MLALCCAIIVLKTGVNKRLSSGNPTLRKLKGSTTSFKKKMHVVIHERILPFVARMLKSLRRLHLDVGEAMNDAGVYNLVDGDHGRVLEVVDSMYQTEAHFEQEAQSGAEFFPPRRRVFFRLQRLLRAAICFNCSLRNQRQLLLDAKQNRESTFIYSAEGCFISYKEVKSESQSDEKKFEHFRLSERFLIEFIQVEHVLLSFYTTPASTLPLLARLLTEPVEDKASISTEAELASSVDSVLRAADPTAVAPLAVLSFLRILAGLLLRAAFPTLTQGPEAFEFPGGSVPTPPPAVCGIKVQRVLLPAPRPDQQSLENKPHVPNPLPQHLVLETSEEAGWRQVSGRHSRSVLEGDLRPPFHQVQHALPGHRRLAHGQVKSSVPVSILTKPHCDLCTLSLPRIIFNELVIPNIVLLNFPLNYNSQDLRVTIEVDITQALENLKMVFSVAERIKIATFYIETKSIIQTQRRYRNEFNCRVAPTAKTILRIARKLNEKGVVHNLHKGNSGRRRTARTQQHIEAVRISVNQSSKKDTEDVRHKSVPCSSRWSY
ncbi:hypothetical protein C0J52_23448 [Blattella germanica]|nr:hypothetical protein C0J52_23448 [Blattella germanica]